MKTTFSIRVRALIINKLKNTYSMFFRTKKQKRVSEITDNIDAVEDVNFDCWCNDYVQQNKEKLLRQSFH